MRDRPARSSGVPPPSPQHSAEPTSSSFAELAPTFAAAELTTANTVHAAYAARTSAALPAATITETTASASDKLRWYRCGGGS